MSDAKEWEAARLARLEDLYRRYAGWLHDRLRRRIGAQDAADVVQDTYARIAPRADSDLKHPKAYLLTVALNIVRDRSRRGVVMDRLLYSDAERNVEGAVQLDAVLLKQVILTMPPLYRDVFVLARFDGMTYPEIADARGLSVQTVKWRMARALEHCAARLDV